MPRGLYLSTTRVGVYVLKNILENSWRPVRESNRVADVKEK